MAARSFYRPQNRARIDALEARRRELGMTQEQLCLNAGMSVRAYRQMLRDGRGFPGRLNALALSLRAFDRQGEADAEAFPWQD